ncbi:MAG: hypothetical protein ACOX7J_09500, partial [Bacillota bacterium]
MKKIVFWIVTFFIVLAGISAAVYQWEFVAPSEDDPGYEQPIPSEPDPVMLEVDKPLYYSEMPEAEDIPLDQYPCDLTLIIEAIEELDEP